MTRAAPRRLAVVVMLALASAALVPSARFAAAGGTDAKAAALEAAMRTRRLSELKFE